MAHRIEFTSDAREHLKACTARQRAVLLAAVRRKLIHQPAVPARNRKPMDPDKRMPIAPWELRVGELRVYYAVKEQPEATVTIVAVGRKVRDRVWIGGKEVEA